MLRVAFLLTTFQIKDANFCIQQHAIHFLAHTHTHPYADINALNIKPVKGRLVIVKLLNINRFSSEAMFNKASFFNIKLSGPGHHIQHQAFRTVQQQRFQPGTLQQQDFQDKDEHPVFASHQPNMQSFNSKYIDWTFNAKLPSISFLNINGLSR